MNESSTQSEDDEKDILTDEELEDALEEFSLDITEVLRGMFEGDEHSSGATYFLRVIPKIEELLSPDLRHDFHALLPYTDLELALLSDAENIYRESALLDERISDWLNQGVVHLLDRQPKCLDFLQFLGRYIDTSPGHYEETGEFIRQYAVEPLRDSTQLE